MNLNWTDPRLIAVAVAVVVIIAVIAWMYVRKRKSTTAGLRQKFGSEYDRAVLAHGSKAEAKLADREKRIDKLNIRSDVLLGEAREEGASHITRRTDRFLGRECTGEKTSTKW